MTGKKEGELVVSNKAVGTSETRGFAYKARWMDVVGEDSVLYYGSGTDAVAYSTRPLFCRLGNERAKRHCKQVTRRSRGRDTS